MYSKVAQNKRVDNIVNYKLFNPTAVVCRLEGCMGPSEENAQCENHPDLLWGEIQSCCSYEIFKIDLHNEKKPCSGCRNTISHARPCTHILAFRRLIFEHFTIDIGKAIVKLYHEGFCCETMLEVIQNIQKDNLHFRIPHALSEFVKHCQIESDIVQYCQILSDIVRYC